MANGATKLEWCIVRLGEDMNWWVEEISDAIHWDVDGLSVLDPRQLNYIIDLLDALRDYDFVDDIFESAFYGFTIDKKIDEDKVRLSRRSGKLLGSEDMIFTLPDLIDDEQGPYADFLDHITKLRVKLLNDVFSFEQKLTVEELEDTIREEQNIDFMEGRAVHVFNEVCKILEYVPSGYEIDEDGTGREAKDVDDDIEEEFPDIEEDEKIEEDETMKWDEDEEEGEDFFDEEEESEGEGEDEEDDDFDDELGEEEEEEDELEYR